MCGQAYALGTYKYFLTNVLGMWKKIQNIVTEGITENLYALTSTRVGDNSHNFQT